ncbi:DUF692 domain-containing protein [Phaeobacter sp. 11ANDIMAR09]|uniref:MNIO family bufferin maturase n=1 Tax=Phaeobacter sp. 11ANDIMAR09 TaxID=1225647 RepID=UPI0006D6CCF9|nr:DUF692 domain-containing protein [Phaeobacter sp. 11ANDIMAR09]KPD13894.1 hypothetical protein AN476_04115 [Phaeobacter sp. 11ANDIMAR09]
MTPQPGDISALPRLGLGLGLRNSHFDHILSSWPDVDWFEAISENFMDSGGRPRQVIRKVAERYPVVLHGVSLSIGSSDPLNMDYLHRLKRLAQEVQPQWISDHLCWTGVMGVNSHDLLPVPLTEATLDHIAARVHRVQEVLDRPLILENPSTYLDFRANTLSEPDFLRALCARTGCGLLLDVNNVYVSCFNADSDPADYFDSFPWNRVVQMHLAGHTDCGTHLIDTHDQPVRPEVWALFALAWTRSKGAATLLEWDGNIPSFEDCHAELLKSKAYMKGGLSELVNRLTPDPVPLAISNPVNFMVPDVMAGAAEMKKG